VVGRPDDVVAKGRGGAGEEREVHRGWAKKRWRSHRRAYRRKSGATKGAKWGKAQQRRLGRHQPRRKFRYLVGEEEGKKTVIRTTNCWVAFSLKDGSPGSRLSATDHTSAEFFVSAGIASYRGTGGRRRGPGRHSTSHEKFTPGSGGAQDPKALKPEGSVPPQRDSLRGGIL